MRSVNFFLVSKNQPTTEAVFFPDQGIEFTWSSPSAASYIFVLALGPACDGTTLDSTLYGSARCLAWLSHGTLGQCNGERVLKTCKHWLSEADACEAHLVLANAELEKKSGAWLSRNLVT